jgi:serine/threonine protein kinase
MNDGQGAKDARATKAASPAARSGARGPVRPSAELGKPPAALGSSDSQPGEGAPAATTDATTEATTDEEFDPRIGTLLGDHYRILERLGAGGMGTVYLVVHVHLKKKFAAKILNDDTARRPDALARFQQEAVSASKLDHENIGAGG